MDSVHQMPEIPAAKAKTASAINTPVTWLWALLVMTLISATFLLNKDNEKIAAQKKQIDDLTAQVAHDQKELDNRTLAIEKAFAGDGTKTILIDTNGPGGAYTVEHLLTENLAARQYGISLIGRAWVIPRKIVPQTTDGSLGFQFAWIYPDGKIEGWFQPQRSK